MESLESKDTSTGPEEPIKSEGIVPSPDTNSERSNGATSPPPNCSICLGHLVNTSFTDSCLHQFCFHCLLQWSKIKTECPLCKQTFKSIIHNVRSEGDYDQYPVHMLAHQVATLDVTADIHINGGQWDVAVGVGVPVRPFMYRTTMGANRRYGTILNPEAVANREQIPSIAPQISGEERRRRNANPIDYRRTVYRHGIWAASLPDAFGRFRESSVEYYRRHPAEVNRLIPWLNRELQVLLNNNRPHIAYVMGIITDILTQYDIRSVEFRNIIRGYFGIHTDHFVHELSNYARTNFDLVGYDQHVTYMPNRGLSNEYVQRTVSPTSSSSSSSTTDSEVRVLRDNIFDFPRLNAYHMPSVGPHIIDMPGPSSVGHAFRLLPSYTVPDVFTISSTSSSSENECEVIGYVKPRHERTPEIIDLSSSSSEVEEVNIASQSTSNDNVATASALPPKDEEQPSTSSYCCPGVDIRRTRRQTDDALRAQMYEYLDSTSESDSEENDSDYKPASSKTRRYKSTSKKASKSTTRKLRTRKRKKSTVTLRKRDKVSLRNRYSSDGSDNESPDREPCTSRGTKRYHSKSSEASESEKSPKKSNKRNKKSKSSKKTKKRTSVSSSSSKRVVCHYSSSSSSSSSCSACNSDSEAENNKSSRRRKKKSSSSAKSFTFYSSEEPSATEKSSPKSSGSSSSRRASTQKHNDRFPESDLFYYHRPESSRRSSNSSMSDGHPADRLLEHENDNNRDVNRQCTSDEEEENKTHERRSSSPSSGVVSSSNPNKESYDKSTAVTTSIAATEQTSSPSSERLSETTSSASSSKSDASTRTEHSESSKASRDRRRSHKKRKDLKKRRRSRS